MQAIRRGKYAKTHVEATGVGGDRPETFNLGYSDGPRFTKIETEMTERMRELEPSPVTRGKKEKVG